MRLPAFTSLRAILASRPFAAAVVMLVVGSTSLHAEEPPETVDTVERVTFRQAGTEQSLAGRILIAATDGGMLLESADGTQTIIQANEVITRTSTNERFVPLTQEEMAERLLAELPDGFRIHTSRHYVVGYDTSRAYAQWLSSLLERLHKAFTNYWDGEGLTINEPEFPLVALVFSDRQTYDQASRTDLPGGAGRIVGYYSLRSNHVNMYDLTGIESLRGPGNQRGSLREINQMLSQPAAEPLVATIVHEATHQIAFNCGLQTRFADIPLWLSEGMAVYFETPDLSSDRGWGGIGRVNYPRLDLFQQNLANWNDASLTRLVSESQPFRDPTTAIDAYADAWALNYYLIKFRSREYAAYLKMLAAKRPLMPDDPATRLEEFRHHFGNIGDLEADFLRRMSRVD